MILPPEQVVSAGLARWGWYGPNGAGKTDLLSTCPLLSLIVSADRENVDPFRGKRNFFVYKIGHWDQLADILKMFQQPGKHQGYRDWLRAAAQDPAYYPILGAKLQDPDVKAGRKSVFDMLAFDTWTRVQALAVNKIVGYDIVKPGQEAEYIGRAPKLPRGYEQWQQIGAMAGEWMGYFESLPVHVVFTFQELKREAKTELDVPEIGPAMTPEALKTVRDSLKMVGRLYVDLADPKANGVAPTQDAAQAAPGIEINVPDTNAAESLRAINPSTVETRMLLVGKHPLFFSKGDSRKLGYVVREPTWDKLARATLEGY